MCGYVVAYAPDSEAARRAKAAVEGPLARRLAEVNAEIEAELKKAER